MFKLKQSLDAGNYGAYFYTGRPLTMEEIVDRAFKQVPPEWVAGEEDEFERLLEKLLARRKRVPDLVADARRSRLTPCPNWP